MCVFLARADRFISGGPGIFSGGVRPSQNIDITFLRGRCEPHMLCCLSSKGKKALLLDTQATIRKAVLVISDTKHSSSNC